MQSNDEHEEMDPRPPKRRKQKEIDEGEYSGNDPKLLKSALAAMRAKMKAVKAESEAVKAEYEAVKAESEAVKAEYEAVKAKSDLQGACLDREAAVIFLKEHCKIVSATVMVAQARTALTQHKLTHTALEASRDILVEIMVVMKLVSQNRRFELLPSAAILEEVLQRFLPRWLHVLVKPVRNAQTKLRFGKGRASSGRQEDALIADGNGIQPVPSLRSQKYAVYHSDCSKQILHSALNFFEEVLDKNPTSPAPRFNCVLSCFENIYLISSTCDRIFANSFISRAVNFPWLDLLWSFLSIAVWDWPVEGNHPKWEAELQAIDLESLGADRQTPVQASWDQMDALVKNTKLRTWVKGLFGRRKLAVPRVRWNTIPDLFAVLFSLVAVPEADFEDVLQLYADASEEQDEFIGPFVALGCWKPTPAPRPSTTRHKSSGTSSTFRHSCNYGPIFVAGGGRRQVCREGINFTVRLSLAHPLPFHPPSQFDYSGKSKIVAELTEPIPLYVGHRGGDPDPRFQTYIFSCRDRKYELNREDEEAVRFRRFSALIGFGDGLDDAEEAGLSARRSKYPPFRVCFKLVPNYDTESYNTELAALVRASEANCTSAPRLVALGTAVLVIPRLVLVTDLVGSRLLGERSVFEVMEYLPAEEWQDHPDIVSRKKWLDLQHSPTCIPLLWKEMLKAVKELHRCNIVHGDLKPDHFMIDRNACGEDSNVCKIIDFGSAEIIKKITPLDEKEKKKIKRKFPHDCGPRQTCQFWSHHPDIVWDVLNDKMCRFEYEGEQLTVQAPKPWTPEFLSARRSFNPSVLRSVPSDDVASTFASLVYWTIYDAPFRTNYTQDTAECDEGPMHHEQVDQDLAQILKFYNFPPGTIPLCAQPYLYDIATTIRAELSHYGCC